MQDKSERNKSLKKRTRKPRQVEKKWDDDDTYKLIEFIEGMKHIWDPEDEYYKDNRKKESTFREIGEKLNRTPTDCKAKWDNLRVQFRFHYVRQKCRGHTYEVKWKHYPMLHFLVGLKRMGISNKSINQYDEMENSMSSNTCTTSISIQKEVKTKIERDNNVFELEETEQELEQEMEQELEQEMEQEFEQEIERKVEHETFYEPLAIANTKSDSSQIFGDFVADRLRYLRRHNAENVKNKIMQILLEASIAERSNSNS